MTKLALSLVIGASIGGALGGIKSLCASVQSLRNQTLTTQEKLVNIANSSSGSFRRAVSSTVSLGASVLALSQNAIEFESSMADVKKVVDFDSPKQFKVMQQDLLELTRTIPMTANELAQIAASGGQLGIARNDIKGFTEQIAKMSVAFDMGAEESGDAMAKLSNVYKIPIKEIGKLGDAINDLSNTSPAKASEIVRVLGRVGGVAKQFGLSANAATALGGAFIALGKPPEVAGTAINGMLTKLMTADKQGKKFQKALASMGMSAEQLKKNIAKNGEGALVDFLKTVNKMPKKDQMGILTDLFGLEYGDDVAILAGNVKLLEGNLNQLSGKKYLGSMDKEFQARAATTENNLTLLKNSLTEIGISVGQYLLPVINEVVSAVKPLLLNIAQWIRENSFLVKGGMILAASLGAVYTGLNLTVAALGVAAKSMLVYQKSMSAYQKTVATSKLIHTKFIASITKMRLATTLAGGGIKGFGRAMWMANSALLANPMVWVGAAIVGGALLIYKYWKPIKGFFTGVFDGIKQSCAPLMPVFNLLGGALSSIWATASPFVMPIIDFFKSLFSFEQEAEGGARNFGLVFGEAIGGAITSVISFFSNMWTTVTGFFTSGIANISSTILSWSPLELFYQAFQSVMSWFGVDLPKSFADFGGNIVNGLVNGVKNTWNAAKEKINELGSSVKNWFAEKLGIHSPSRVFMGFGENTVQGFSVGIDKTLNVAQKSSDELSQVALSPLNQQAKNNVETLPLAQATNESKSNSQVANSQGVVIHFNPTINVESNKQGIVEQVKEGLKMNAYELEKMIREITANQQWRSY